MSAIRNLMLACATVATVPAIASSDDWSVAFDHGQTQLSGSSGTDFGLPYDHSDDAQGWRLALAYDIGGPFRVELAHDALGEFRDESVTVLWLGPGPFDPSQCPGPSCTVFASPVVRSAIADSVALHAGFEPFARASLGVELGVAAVRFDDEVYNQTVARVGLSAGYAVSSDWSVELRWTVATLDRGYAEDALTTLRVGVRYGF